MNLLNISDKIIEKRTEQLHEFISNNKEMIPYQIELSKEMDAVGKDPTARMTVIRDRLRNNLNKLLDIAEELK